MCKLDNSILVEIIEDASVDKEFCRDYWKPSENLTSMFEARKTGQAIHSSEFDLLIQVSSRRLVNE